MAFVSELLTRDNAPPRLVLDEASMSMREVFGKACHAIMHDRKLAYVWRRNAQQVSATSVALAKDVFIPIVKCVPFWRDRKHSDGDVQFDVSQSISLMVADVLSNQSDHGAEFRVESFQRGMSLRYADNYCLSLLGGNFQKGRIQERNVLVGNILSYECDRERGYPPHIDGNVEPSGQKEIELKQLNMRVLAVHQGDGTRFWPEDLDKYGGEDALKDRNEIDCFYLNGKSSYHTQEGDIIIFNSRPVRLSHAFVHQARPSRSVATLQEPHINGLRFVEVCDVSIPVSWSPPM